MCYDTYMFTKTPWPFKLKYFFANPDVDCGPFESHHPHVPFVPHMKGIEVVHGINFWRQRDPGFAAAIDLMAPTLREWIDRPGVTWSEDHFERDETPKDVGKDLVFPRLLKLNGVWSEVWTRCEFPALQELTYNALRTRFTTTQLAKDQPVNVISRSPSLKRLDILLPLLDSATKKIMWAIAELQHLKELNLWFRYTGGLTLKGLVEFQMDGDDSQTPVRVILPKLHTLGIFIKVSSLSTESFFVHDLCQFLCHRFFLLQGCSRDEAKKRAEAALYLYERTSQRQNKPSRKKHSTEGVALASESAYKGEFETRDDVTRERFTPVLPLLVSNPSKKPGKEKMICMPNPLLDQLVGNYAELDIDPEFVTIPKRMS
uniref:Uncharacterized protein n=2 Tax=Kalmanozyma brasiliensis (strain GHG001) TaxID=1365824 RepID=V5EVJ9_KALBG